MSSHPHGNPWLYFVLAPFLLWGAVGGIIRGRLRLGGGYGSYVIKRSSEPVPFWTHVGFVVLLAMIMVVAGIKGTFYPDAQVPWMAPHARQNYLWAVLGLVTAVLFGSYASEGKVPSTRQPITRKDRPINYYLTLLVLLGASVYFLSEAWQGWPWVVSAGTSA